MAEKRIITIGRQFGSGGHEIGEKLAKRLDIKFYDKDLIKLVAKESGLCEKVLESYDEKPTSSLLYSIVMDIYPSVMYTGPTIDQQIYQANYDTIRKLSMESCVIVTSVFIYANSDFRATRVADEYHVSDAKAREMMSKTDKKRASYYNFQSDKKWGMAASYNLCLESSTLGIEGSVNLIEDYLRYRGQI